jgi:hypothetical protein
MSTYDVRPAPGTGTRQSIPPYALAHVIGRVENGSGGPITGRPADQNLLRHRAHLHAHGHALDRLPVRRTRGALHHQVGKRLEQPEIAAADLRPIEARIAQVVLQRFRLGKCALPRPDGVGDLEQRVGLGRLAAERREDELGVVVGVCGRACHQSVTGLPKA